MGCTLPLREFTEHFTSQSIPDDSDATPSNRFDSPAEAVAAKRHRGNDFGTEERGLELAGDRVEPQAMPSEGAVPSH